MPMANAMATRQWQPDDRDDRDNNDDEGDDSDGDDNDDEGYLKVHTMYYYLVDLINLFSCI